MRSIIDRPTGHSRGHSRTFRDGDVARGKGFAHPNHSSSSGARQRPKTGFSPARKAACVATLAIGLALTVRIREVYASIEMDEIEEQDFAYNLEGTDQ